MPTDEADWPGRRYRLELWTQTAKEQPQSQADDDQTRDPEQSDGAFVTECVIERPAEVGEIQPRYDQ